MNGSCKLFNIFRACSEQTRLVTEKSGDFIIRLEQLALHHLGWEHDDHPLDFGGPLYPCVRLPDQLDPPSIPDKKVLHCMAWLPQLFYR